MSGEHFLTLKVVRPGHPTQQPRVDGLCPGGHGGEASTCMQMTKEPNHCLLGVGIEVAELWLGRESWAHWGVCVDITLLVLVPVMQTNVVRGLRREETKPSASVAVR